MRKIGGVITATLTPFSDDGRPNEKAIGSLLDYILAGGIDGLYILGTTGLGPLMSVEERKLVAEAMVTTAGKRVMRIIHIGGLVVQDILSLARHAEQIGADAVACLTPFYYHLDTKALEEFYAKIAEATTLPILLYNIPQNTGYNIRPATIAAIVERVPSVAGIKDSSGILAQLMETQNLLGDNFAVLNGSDKLVLPTLAAGLAGSVTALSNIAPKLVKDIDNAYRQGDLSKAQQNQRNVAQLANTLGEKLIPALYTILNNKGINVGKPKPPLTPLTKQEEQEILQKTSKIPIET